MKCMLGIVAVSTILAASAAIAEDYPTRQITYIVAQNPGGTNDTMARTFVPAMAKELGQDIIIEYRPGGASAVGMGMVKDSDPDGYTLGQATSGSFVVQPLVNPDLIYDPLNDFELVYKYADVPYALFVNKGLGVETLEDFIALAKNTPDKLNFGSGAAKSAGHFATAQFVEAAGIAEYSVLVPYQGGSEVSTALMGGEIDFHVSPLNIGARGQLDSGKIIGLAVSRAERDPAFPEIPTFAEAGLPGYKATVWFGVVVPKGTPKDIVNKLNEAGNAAAKSPEVIAALELAGIRAAPGHTPEEFDAQLRSDTEEYRKLLDSGALSLD